MGEEEHFVYPNVTKLEFINVTRTVAQISEKTRNCCCNMYAKIYNLMLCPHSSMNEEQLPTNFLQRSSSSVSLPRLEERMKKELQYYFMNPCQKYKARRRKPYKLAIQIFKIAMVTLQLIVFGQKNQELVRFVNDNVKVFEVSLFQNQSDLFMKDDVYLQINKIRKQIVSFKNESVGNYGHSRLNMSPSDSKAIFDQQQDCGSTCFPVVMCIDEYLSFHVDLKEDSFSFDPNSQKRSCYLLKPWNIEEGFSFDQNTSLPLFNGSIYHIQFSRLIKLQLYLGVRTVRMTPHGYHQADCYNITLTISYDNSAHSGIIHQSLSSQFYLSQCSHKKHQSTLGSSAILMLVLDCIIISLCNLSVVLCTRSLWRGRCLCKSFERFYWKRFKIKLDWWDKLEFFNGWYFLIIISDFLTISGSIIKVVIQMKWKGVINYDACSVFLGVGCLCVWIGVLRYAGFFRQYNILVLTLKRALPHVLRFMVCASLLYLGFMFCGWVVLGPYHEKFRNPIVASEALFSLINGDDMYMTFEEMSKRSTLAWVFSQIYLYIFISLFIYVVLSLFIAVIMETYETIKEWQTTSFPPQSRIEKFLAQESEDSEEYEYDFNSDTYCCFCLYHSNARLEEEPDDEELLVDV